MGNLRYNMKARAKHIVYGVTFLTVIVGGVSYVGVARPFPCRHDKHHVARDEKLGAWRRGELSDEQILSELIGYAELRPSFGEKPKCYDKKSRAHGGYSTVNCAAIQRIGEIPTPEAFEVLGRYATCSDRQLNAAAVFALEKRGDKQAVPSLMKLLEMEDLRQTEWIKTATFARNRHLLTCHTLRVLSKLIGSEAVPLLKDFLARKKRMFKNEVEETIFELENDITKSINVESHQVEIKLEKTRYLPGEEMTVEYSIKPPVGMPVQLCAIGDIMLIDGSIIRQRNPRVYRGGFSIKGGVSLKGLPLGEHTLTVRIAGTDKSDAATFHILSDTSTAPEPLPVEN
jgi:hypothetical protein